MKKFLMGLLSVVLFSVLLSHVGRLVAYAGENDTEELEEELGVTISDESGSTYALREGGTLYVNRQLKFTIGEIANAPDGEITDEKTYYSFSYDGGESFSEENELNGSELKLSPVNSGEEYYIRFYRMITLRRENTDEENDHENETEYEELTFMCKSRCYHIVFDTKEPEISETSGIDFESWERNARTGYFTASDYDSYIDRVIVKADGEVLYEYHFDEESGDKNEENSFLVDLDKEALDESGRRIEITAVDGAGNVNEKEYVYYLDMTSPSVAYSGCDDGSVNSHDVGINIYAEDNLISKCHLCIWSIRRLGDKQWINPEREIGAVNNAINEYVEFSEDGEYTVAFKAVDGAGNESETISISLRVDKTSPDISIEGFEYGLDYRTDVGVKLKAREDFYEDAAAEYTIIRKWPKGESVYSREQFNPDGSNYLRNLTLSEDGDYSIFFKVTDAAGNSSEKSVNVRVDKNAPAIAITGLKDKEITAKSPILLLDAGELFYDSAYIKATLYSRMDGGSYNEVLNKEFSMEDENVKIPLQIDEEGSYILNVSAGDRAGNETESNIEFTIDKSAPEIGWLGMVNKKYLKKLSFPARFLDNITDMTQTSYQAYLNAYELSEGTTITKDGKYVLRVIAIDEAGNISDESAEFIIDATPPRIIAKGITDRQNVRVGGVVTLSLLDKNDRFTYLSVNDRDMEIDNDGRSCSISIDSPDEYRINVKAVDEAGNETEKLFVLSASALKMPESISKVVKQVMGSEENNDEKITKISDEKYIYFLAPLIIGILGACIWIYKARGRIDVAK